MNKPIHPAVAEHAMEENEKLREALRCIADLPMDRCSTENDYRLSAAKAIALGALSQQAEPATAQDELLPCPFCGNALEVSKRRYNPHARCVTENCKGAQLPLLNIDQPDDVARWNTRPAQTEQQPVGYQFQDREGVWKQFMSEKHYEDTLADGTWPIRAIYAAPIAQTAPQPSEESLVQNAKALLALDERGALAPHGIGGLAREVIEKLIAHIERTTPQPEQSALSGKCWIEVIGGREGPSIYIGDGEIAHRLAGNKPWGGGRTLHSFKVDVAELVREASALAIQGSSKP
ncbi:hypothetical protein [Stutzerimonas nitrititolerans]|uniref:hypothetical protein n=1 Tax=Stutzerimonas nitrititolerans TaxID=2482751 RepID=UPI0028A2C7E3|nr:hypothetical protein [Stutzerimonas nitrititolerans]